ncbi:MAG: hypothetical protein AAFV98_03500 [Chloroflexota bacterium]
MPSQNRPYRKIMLATIFCVSSCLVIAFTLVGIQVNPVSLYREPDTGQARWEEQAISHYEMTVLFTGNSIREYKFTVEDSTVTSITDLGSPLTASALEGVFIDTTPDWYLTSYSSYLPSTFQDYTILGLFEYVQGITTANSHDFIRTCFDTATSRYEVSFNQQYGYIEEMTYSNCGDWNVGLGLVCPLTTHCSSGFVVTDFVSRE